MNSLNRKLHDKLANVNCIIDGHNLIAHIPGLNLGILDDEERLIQLLIRYGLQQHRGKLEVYFDGAPVGQSSVRTFGRVKAYFVPQKQTADEAILRRLVKLGKSTRNWKVISSDRSIQTAAHEVHANVQNSEDFAQHMLEILRNRPGDLDKAVDPSVTPAEVDEWLAIFKPRKSIK